MVKDVIKAVDIANIGKHWRAQVAVLRLKCGDDGVEERVISVKCNQ